MHSLIRNLETISMQKKKNYTLTYYFSVTSPCIDTDVLSIPPSDLDVSSLNNNAPLKPKLEVPNDSFTQVAVRVNRSDSPPDSILHLTCGRELAIGHKVLQMTPEKIIKRR